MIDGVGASVGSVVGDNVGSSVGAAIKDGLEISEGIEMDEGLVTEVGIENNEGLEGIENNDGLLTDVGVEMDGVVTERGDTTREGLTSAKGIATNEGLTSDEGISTELGTTTEDVEGVVASTFSPGSFKSATTSSTTVSLVDVMYMYSLASPATLSSSSLAPGNVGPPLLTDTPATPVTATSPVVGATVMVCFVGARLEVEETTVGAGPPAPRASVVGWWLGL